MVSRRHSASIRVDVRLRNFVKPEQMPYVSVTKKTLDSGDYAAALKRAAELVDLPALRARQKTGEPDGRLIGVGLASFYEQTAYGTGPFGYSAWGIELVPGHGAGGGAAHRRRRTGARSRIAFARPGTRDRVRADRARSAGHRSAQGLGALRRHLDVAGRHRHLYVALDGDDRRRGRQGMPRADAADLQDRRASPAMQGGRRADPGRPRARPARQRRILRDRPRLVPPSRRTAGRCRSGGLAVTAGHKPHDPGVFSYSAHAAVVAVDPDTGAIELLDYAIVADCGTRVNPLLVEGQVVGGFSNGLGNALYEESATTPGPADRRRRLPTTPCRARRRCPT